jgi:hypothetical protein
MEFTEIRSNTCYGDANTTVTFKCDPPMLFHTFSSEAPRLPGSKAQFLRFSHVTVCAFRECEEFPYGRTVIHASDKLQGGDGFCYGALADAIVMDGHKNAWTALGVFGYQEAEAHAEAA